MAQMIKMGPLDLAVMPLGIILTILGTFGQAHCATSAGTRPQQVHISTASSDEMIIVWSTMNNTKDSFVQYGIGTINMEVPGISNKFVDGGPLKRFQFIHKVVLTGLQPETSYVYRVGSKMFGFSKHFSFRTWPKGDNWSPSLLIFGDLGVVNPQALPSLINETAKGIYHSLLHVGDFAYDLEDDNGELGNEFMHMIEPIAANLPYMTCPGNHEDSYNFSHYRNRFVMPGDEDKRMYYSYTMGPIRFISLATELVFFPEYGLVPIVKHFEWLQQQLKEANLPENRAKHPWVITFGHRPMYCSNDNNDDCTHHESLVRVGVPFIHLLGWEKYFYDNGVDLAIWAHEHSYERLWPVYNRQVKNGSYNNPYTNPGAPVHIVTGSPGCKFNHDPFDKVVDDWSAFRSTDYGFTRMKVFNSSHLYVEQVSNNKGGAVIDKFIIIKDKHGSYASDNRPFLPRGDPMKKLWGQWKSVLQREHLLKSVVKMAIP